MKKTLPLFLLSLCSPLLAYTQLSSQVEVINSWSQSGQSQALFSPDSTFRCLQDALLKEKILLKTFKNPTSPLFQKTERTLKIKEKINSLFTKGNKTIRFSDDPNDKLLFWNLPPDISTSTLKLIPLDRKILFIFDDANLRVVKDNPSISELFYKIYTWDSTLIDDKKYFPFHIPCLQKIQDGAPSFSQRELVLAENELTSSPLTEQIALLEQYKFLLCNPKEPFSEGKLSQLFKAFAAKTIPICFHPDTIQKFVPKQCYINAKEFASAEELNHFLCSMTEEHYLQLTHNIKIFLESPEAKEFSMEKFSGVLLEALRN